MLKPFYLPVLPWDEKAFIGRAYAEKRPAWVIPVVLLGLALIAYTWYQHFTAGVEYSIVITLLFSLTAPKGLTLIFDYRLFQRWVRDMLRRDRGRRIVLVDIAIGIVLLTLYLY